MPLAPAHLQAVTFARGGQGVEKAVMTAMAQRILNDPQVRFTALGFRGANHGIKSSFINNHFRGDKKVPTFDWPLIDYPKNQSDESRALEDTLKQLK